MSDANVRFYAPPSGEVRTLHIETTGAVVNITVGLVNAEGRPVTRVDIVPDSDKRGGDGEGRIWDLWQDGSLDCDGVARLVMRADPRHDDAAEAEARRKRVRKGEPTDEYYSLVTTKDIGEGEREHIAMRIMHGSDEGPFVSGYADDDEGN